MESKKNYKRKIYLIDKSFQLKFILRFCALLVASGILTIGMLYYLSGEATTVSIVNSRVVVRSTADFIFPILVQTTAIVVIISGLTTIVVTLLFSHKIAGPLYRFRKVAEDMGEGNFSSNFHIRKLDQLQNLADTLNLSISKIRGQLVALKDNYVSLKNKVDSLSENEVTENKRSVIRELKITLEELGKAVKYFKT